MKDKSTDSGGESSNWIPIYDERCEEIRQYLKSRGCSKGVLYSTRKQLNNLKDYLIRMGIPYSPEASERWLASLESVGDLAQISAARMSDMFTTGQISPANSYPNRIFAFVWLAPAWMDLVDGFFSSARPDCPDSTHKEMRNSIAHVLYALQGKGIAGFSEITYQALREVCDYETAVHQSDTILKRYLCESAAFFDHYAECGKCERGFGLYFTYRSETRDGSFEDLSSEHRERIDSLRSESLDFPAEEFYALIDPFCERLASFQYNSSVLALVRLFLQKAYLFFWIQDVGYHPEIADIFLRIYSPLRSDTLLCYYRRALVFFREYTEEGDFIPRQIRRMPLLMDALPEWCKTEMRAFFAWWNRAYPGSSAETNHRSALTRFCSFLADKGICSFNEVNPALLKDFNRTDQHKTVKGKNGYLSSIRQFLRYLEDKGDIPVGSHAALPSMAMADKKIPVIFSDEELDTIKEYSAKAETPIELRDTAIMAIALRMGLRESDIVALDMDSIDWKSRAITIMQEKTDVGIRLPMPVDVGNKIYSYIKYGRHRTDSPALFIKNCPPYDRLSAPSCNIVLKRMLPGWDVPGAGFHTSRRTFATIKLRSKVTPDKIATLLGQRNIDSLDCYLSHDEENMRKCAISPEERGIGLPESYYEH